MTSQLVSLFLLLASASAADTVVVCPEQFRPALADWIEHRTAEGHELAIVSNLGTAEEVRDRVRREARDGSVRFIVLIGDAPPWSAVDRRMLSLCVPVHRARAKVNVRWGSEPHIATDNWYADMDGDQVPDAAVGRITADSADQLRAIVKKILAYERSVDAGMWRRRIHFVAGLGGFGKLADAALELTAKRLITTGIPAGFATKMTHASWRSPYCPDPREFGDTAVAQLNGGCLFWVYMGHGLPWSLDRVVVPSGTYHILGTEDVRRFDCRGRSPIAILLACYTAAFDAQSDCLAERMLAAEGGPVAVIGGSRVTMPYAMSVLGTEMLDQCFVHERKTIGEVFLQAKRNMMLADRQDSRSRMLDLLAATVETAAGNLGDERAEHALLFNLLGDPLLRLRHPRQVDLDVQVKARAGEAIEVTGTSPVPGRCTVELIVQRDRLTFRPPSRAEYDGSDKALSHYQEIYQRANDPRLSTTQLQIDTTPFHVKLPIPDNAWGACHVRVFVAGASDFALGSADVRVGRAQRNSSGKGPKQLGRALWIRD